MALVKKNLPTNAGGRRSNFNPWVRKIPGGSAWQPNPSILAWGIPWAEEPGGLQSIGSRRVRHDRVPNTRAER